jgi:hypothetical protein
MVAGDYLLGIQLSIYESEGGLFGALGPVPASVT